jgi:hypothetical protein
MTAVSSVFSHSSTRCRVSHSLFHPPRTTPNVMGNFSFLNIYYLFSFYFIYDGNPSNFDKWIFFFGAIPHWQVPKKKTEKLLGGYERRQMSPPPTLRSRRQ